MTADDNVRRCEAARSGVHPGFSRPIIDSHHALREGIRPFLSSESKRSAHNGIATSYRLPTSTPKKAAGVTPITGNLYPFRLTLLPGTPGLPPNSLCQNA